MKRSTYLLAAQGVAAIAVGARLAKGAHRYAPAVTPSSDVQRADISIVIPARNEAERVGVCLEALQATHPDVPVIVVDDESTDSTASVARSYGADVVDGRPLPTGWVGKPWALQQGLARASTEWVIFLDADTLPQRGLCAGALNAAHEHKADFLSLTARFICDTPVEQALHASFLATLVYRFGPADTQAQVRPNRLIANGQCTLVKREWMLEQGGFHLSAAHMTDDIALVRALAERGARTAFLDGGDLIHVRMHSSVPEVAREWCRSLPMADVTPPPVRILDALALWLTLALPLPRLLLRRGTKLDAILLAIRVALLIPLRRAYTAPRWGLLAAPVTDLAAVSLFTQASIRPARTWRGRQYKQIENEPQ